ncbi:MAG TPA: tetratricopeptide repeat protein [Caulobacteraceae bacterium]|nr:tetratricopeptide repeat protein [Caulobacteraceae bacterium]
MSDTATQNAGPNPVELRFRQALALHQQGRFGEAEQAYREVLTARPNHFDAVHLLGVLFGQTGRPGPAVDLISRAIAIDPNAPTARANRAKILNDLGRPAEAIADCEQALALNPRDVGAYVNRGNALHALASYQAAIDSYDRAIALNPGLASAYNDRGNTLLALSRYSEALVSYDQALALNPAYVDAMVGRGAALQRQRRRPEALEAYQRAIGVNPQYADAHNNLANLLVELKRLDEAADAYAKAVELKPGCEFALGGLVHTRMKLCDWRGLDRATERLIAGVRRGERICPPFPLTAMPCGLDVQLQAAKTWIDAISEKAPPAPAFARPATRDKLRIGYFSADFYAHATAWLTAGLFEAHDRSRFEIVAFSFGAERNDETAQRLKKAFDRFIDVRDRSDAEIAALSRELKIDIAVDLKGFTADCRLNIFAFRAAPIQVSWLGYPGSMSAGFIDYVIADPVVLPPEHEPFYSEKVVRLPWSYQPNDRQRRIAEVTPTRAAAGLPEQGFVFCCFNNPYKINPEMFERWMRILGSVPGSVLWLMQDSSSAARNLQAEAKARGVEPKRLVFAPRQALPEHLARHRLADLFLDTSPYNAHTTASDALWAGLPVLTHAGDTFASRVGASLLRAVGMEELIVPSWDAYGGLAVGLAKNPERLAAIKAKLAANRMTTPLFDTALFARHIEAAYVAMADRYDGGLQPDHIAVQP